MRSVSAAFLALALLSGCDGPEQTETRTNEERIAALNIDRTPLADADNPILALQAPLKSFLDDCGKEFQTDAGLPAFHEFQVSPATLKRCWALQQTIRDTINKGPGRIPDHDPDGLHVYFLIQGQRANAALAAKSLTDGNPAGAAFHLAFTFEIADYLFTCEPTILPYVFGVQLKRQTFDDLLELYKAAPGPELLSQITTICRNSRFQKSYLETVLRSEARFGIKIYPRLPEWIRKQHEDFGSLFFGFYKPPLSDCSLEQLLAMNYDPGASLSASINEIEASIRWAGEDKPLTQGPKHLLNPTEPRPLEYYKSAPNGLTEIFSDCNMPGPHLNALVTHQILDAQIETALAWLRAEADGVTVTSLDVLVPGYLERVPTDPCDGKPLRGIPGKRLIYSIGFNLQDDKGISEAPPDGDDPAAMDRIMIIPEITP